MKVSHKQINSYKILELKLNMGLSDIGIRIMLRPPLLVATSSQLLVCTHGS